MLLYYQSWMFYNHFIVNLYHFLVLTYWHSAKCQFLFFPCFLHHRKSILDGVQMPRNFTEIFYGPEGTYWALVAPGRRAPTLMGPSWLPWPTSFAYIYPYTLKTSGSRIDREFRRRKASISTTSNLYPVPAPFRRGESSLVAIFIIPAATMMRRE